MASLRDQARAHLEGYIGPYLFDLHALERGLGGLELSLELAHPEVVAALSSWADLAPVQARLAAMAPEVLLAGLALALDAPTQPVPRESAQLLAEAFFKQAVLTVEHPLARLAGGSASAALARATLAASGRELPAAAWDSPWQRAERGASRARHARVSLERLPDFPERFHLAARATTASALDEALIHDFHERFRGQALFLLHELSDAALRRVWAGLDPERVWSNGDLLSLVPRAGLEGLPISLRLVSRLPRELEALSELESPRAAPLMAAGFASTVAGSRRLGRAWLTRFPEAATVGLVPLVLLGEKLERRRALEALELLRQRHAGELEAGLARYTPEQRAQVLAALEGSGQLPARRPVLPAFAEPARLPRLIERGGAAALAADAQRELLALLKATPLAGAGWLEPLRQRFEPGSLTGLATALGEAWLTAGAPPRERWALQALAHFPDDESARRLAVLAASLAPRGLSARAQEMVEVLAAMHTRAGLKLVHELGRRVRSKAFRERAELIFTTAAEQLGLTDDELAERLVPELGLSAGGALDTRPPVRLVLEGLKPRFVDEAGAPVKALPPGRDEEATAQHAELKKRAPALVRELAQRLERRMALGRRMSLEHFLETWLMHGLAQLVAAQVLWGLYDERGALRETFVPGPRGPLDVTGAPLRLPEGRTVGVVHPLELDEAARRDWRRQLGVQPFAQLARASRAVHTVQELLLRTRALVGRQVPTPRILGLEKRGWVRGPAEESGCYLQLSRSVPGGQVDLELSPGVFLGDPRQHPTQELVAIRLRLAESTTPVVLSELELELATLLEAEG